MKRSTISLILSVAATLCLSPSIVSAQTKRSMTSPSVVKSWVFNDALSYAQNIYDGVRNSANLQTQNRIAKSSDAADSETDATSHAISSTINADLSHWTCYPSDYSCFTYGRFYKPAIYPVADNGVRKDYADTGSYVLKRQDSDEDTSLTELPGDRYPCIIESDPNDFVSDNYVDVDCFATAGSWNWLRDNAQIMSAAAAKRLSVYRRSAYSVGDRLATAAQDGLTWLGEQPAASMSTHNRLVIRPLRDIHAELDAVAEAQLAANAKAEFIDHEWERTLDYFAEYGCPRGVWDPNAVDAHNVEVASASPNGWLNYWTARISGRVFAVLFARTTWGESAADSLSMMRAYHSAALAAAAEAQVPAIPAEEHQLDESTYVEISELNSKRASAASIRSLSNAVLSAVRHTWTR